MLFEEFEACLAWWNKREENGRAWKAKASDVLKYDGDGNLLSANLDIKNPNAKEDFEHMPPEKLVEDIIAKEQHILALVNEIQQALTSEDEQKLSPSTAR
jgi:type I restriction enzyme M protein